jgi:hypothetical protein
MNTNSQFCQFLGRSTCFAIQGFEPPFFGCAFCSLFTVPTALAGFTFGYIYINIIYNYFPNYCTTPVLLGVLREVLRSTSDTPHSVQLLYVNDRSVAEETT